jgi:hypothetical protein
MRDRTIRKLRIWLADMGLGAMIFIALPLILLTFGGQTMNFTFDEVFAGEVVATRAIEMSAPPGPGAENAIVGAAQLRPASLPLLEKRTIEMVVLGLTFSLLVAFNLGFVRHLLRVAPAARREARRRHS